jgi:hypothetical protein
MLLQDFINLTIKEIQDGISEFNCHNKSASVGLPDQIEIETYVVADGDNIKISDNTGTKLKLVIPITSYWVAPKSKE